MRRFRDDPVEISALKLCKDSKGLLSDLKLNYPFTPYIRHDHLKRRILWRYKDVMEISVLYLFKIFVLVFIFMTTLCYILTNICTFYFLFLENKLST